VSLHWTFRRLEVFAAVAECGSLSAAAQQLNIAQPSVSEHIKALERDIGEVLLVRPRGQAARLSPAGEALLPEVTDLLQRIERLSSQASQHRLRRQRRIVISAQRLVSNFILPPFLARFAKENPDIELVVRSGSAEEVIASLATEAVDVGYILSNDPPAQWTTSEIGREPFIFVASPEHPLARHQLVQPEELRTSRFIRGATGSRLSREVDGLLHSIGLTDLNVATHTTDAGIVKQLVTTGVGILFAPHSSVRADLLRGTMKQLPVQAPALTIAIQQLLPSKVPVCRPARLFCRMLEQAEHVA
jgi:molybdate transport repressor ModE-like protein